MAAKPRGGFGGHGILAGVDEIVERHLDILAIGKRQPRFKLRKACRKVSDTPPLNFDARLLVAEILGLIETNWRLSGSQGRSSKNWRFEKKPYIAGHNLSPEKKLEKAISRLGGKAWANQVPTASGLANSVNDKHRNIDLVFRSAPKCFELIELKIRSDNPLYAAIEVVVYGALYIFARTHPEAFPAASPILEARDIRLRVLAPVRYYRGCRFDWMERELTAGLQRTIEKCLGSLETIDFKFRAFPDVFTCPCSDEGLADFLENIGPVNWA